MRPFIVRTTTGRINPENLVTALWPAPNMSRMLLYSVVFHLCFMTSFMVVKALNISFKRLPIVYAVNLVPLSGSGIGGDAQQASTQQVSKLVQKKLDEPKLKPLKEPKTPAPKSADKKQVVLPSRKKVEISKAEKNPKPPTKPTETKMAAASVEKQKTPEPEQVSEEEPKPASTKQVASNVENDFVTSGAPGADITGPAGSAGDIINPELRWYIEIIRRKVWQNWIEPRHALSDGVHSRVVIRFEIGRDGNFVSPPEIFESSNVTVVDQSGYRAVVRSAPFPPLPESYSGNIMGIRFGFEYGENA